jgi:hypothetical protein
MSRFFLLDKERDACYHSGMDQEDKEIVKLLVENHDLLQETLKKQGTQLVLLRELGELHGDLITRIEERLDKLER